MKIEEDIKLDFSNVLLRPKRSTLASRSEVDLHRTFHFKNSNQVWTGIPIITANMDTVGTFEMYNALSKYHMLTCFHKFYTFEQYDAMKQELNREYYILSTGIREDDWEKTAKIIELLNPKFLCVDVANGYSQKFMEEVKKYRQTYPNIILMAGNVVTRELVEELSIAGHVDIIKVGIGPGSVCTTRVQTGCGYPQLSAILECGDAAHGVDTHIISDGGIICPGDIAKAFGAGADFVMIGGLFAGHDESAGELVVVDGKQYKMFYGMSSDTAMVKHYGSMANYRSSEGKTVKIPYKGPVDNTIQSILGGLRSACTYIGAKRLKDIPKCTTFIKVHNQVNNVFS